MTREEQVAVLAQRLKNAVRAHGGYAALAALQCEEIEQTLSRIANQVVPQPTATPQPTARSLDDVSGEEWNRASRAVRNPVLPTPHPPETPHLY